MTPPDARAAPLSALARAKVNLCLHVVGRRADGYHLLDSLVAFPEIGDRLEAAPAARISLSLDGPMAAGLTAGADNLVMRAARALDAWAAERWPTAPARGAALRLDKHLPHAAGLGGGSSDAAAALGLLAALWRLPIGDAALERLALALGADVPVCLRAPRPHFLRGIGERLAPAPALPPFWLALIHPGAAAPTPEVFALLGRADGQPTPPAPDRFDSLDALLDWLGRTRNDLARAAETLTPRTAEARAALASTPGCRLARMSGSGAACFGVYASEPHARAAVSTIGAARPGWWCAAAPVIAEGPVA